MSGASVVRFVLPIETVSENNQREHWANKSKRVRIHRTTARLLTRQARPFKVPCTVLLTRVSPRILDDDNLRGALKATRDGIADALGVDDRDARVAWAYAQQKGRPSSVEVCITEGTDL